MNKKIPKTIKKFFSRMIRIRVAALISNHKKEILLVKQSKRNTEYWLLPGGGVEYGEDSQFALRRELQEEIGFDVKASQFLLLTETIDPLGKKHLIQLLFKTEVSDHDLSNKKFDKDVKDARFFSIEEILQLDLRPDIKDFLKEGKFEPSPHLHSSWILSK